MLRIVYDHKLKIAGIGQTPWQRFGPQYWFDNYKIISQSSVPVTEQQVGIPILYAPAGVKKSPKSKAALRNVLSSEWFDGLVKAELAGYAFLAYRPVAGTDYSGALIAGDPEVAAHFENKVTFREEFSDVLSFAPYEVLRICDLNDDRFEAWSAAWGQFVVQEESMSGGAGTFFVDTIDDFHNALTALGSSSARVVVSQKISGYDVSVQCCASEKYGVFMSGPQRQFINHPLLSNTEYSGGEKFNGVQVGTVVLGPDTETLIKKYVTYIGERLLQKGFRGIFSVDLFMSDSDELYVLEVNPRMTGVTPLYNVLHSQEDIPIPLIHILEVGGFAYDIKRFSANTDLYFGADAHAMLVLRSKSVHSQTVTGRVDSGTYSLSDHQLVSDDLSVLNTDQGAAVVHSYVSDQDEVSPGDKLAAVFVRGAAASGMNFDSELESFVRGLYDRYGFIGSHVD